VKGISAQRRSRSQHTTQRGDVEPTPRNEAVKIVEVTRPRQATPGGSSSRAGRGFLLLGGRPVHCGPPPSSNVLRDILHRMQTPAMKSNLCPPACRSKAITLLSVTTSNKRGPSTRGYGANVNPCAEVPAASRCWA
jgi:hypothetical protein